MNQDSEGFAQLIEQVRQGSNVAFTRLVELYGPHLARYARRKMGSALDARFDSTDFAQSVWESFFKGGRQHEEYSSLEAFLAMLRTMTHNHVVDEFRRQGRQRRAKHGEVSMDEVEGVAGAFVVSREPSPSQAAIGAEVQERLLGGTRRGSGQADRDREVASLKYEGLSHEEIAARLGISVRSVGRILRRMYSEHERCQTRTG